MSLLRYVRLAKHWTDRLTYLNVPKPGGPEREPGHPSTHPSIHPTATKYPKYMLRAARFLQERRHFKHPGRLAGEFGATAGYSKKPPLVSTRKDGGLIDGSVGPSSQETKDEGPVWSPSSPLDYHQVLIVLVAARSGQQVVIIITFTTTTASTRRTPLPKLRLALLLSLCPLILSVCLTAYYSFILTVFPSELPDSFPARPPSKPTHVQQHTFLGHILHPTARSQPLPTEPSEIVEEEDGHCEKRHRHEHLATETLRRRSVPRLSSYHTHPVVNPYETVKRSPPHHQPGFAFRAANQFFHRLVRQQQCCTILSLLLSLLLLGSGPVSFSHTRWNP